MARVILAHRGRRARWATIVAVAVALPWQVRADSHPTPDERRQAQHLVEEGATLHKAKDDAGALAKFQEAYALFPNPKLLFNIALMLSDLGNNADAADALEGYLAAAKADPRLSGTEFPAIAAKRLAQLEPTVGRVELSVVPAESSVTLDSRAGHAGVVYLAPGTHQLVASAPGFEASSQLIAIAAGQRQALAVTLHPLVAAAPLPDLHPAPPAPVAVVSTPAPPPPASIGWAPKVGWCTGGVLGVGAAIMSGVAFSQYQALPRQSGAAPAHLPGAYATELRDARIADALWAGAIVAGGVGTGFWLFAGPAGAGGEVGVGGRF